MSCFMVDKVDIDLLVDLALHGPSCAYRPGNGWGAFHWYWKKKGINVDDPNKLGQMLAAQNARSIRARYVDGGSEMIPDLADRGYAHSHVPMRLTPVEALKHVRYYDYQACETSDWEETEAYAFCDALTSALVNRLPGYEEAPWGWYKRLEEIKASQKKELVL